MRRPSRTSLCLVFACALFLFAACSDNTTAPVHHKHAATLNPAWSIRLGDAISQLAEGVAFDQSGNIIVAGSFEGTTDFGGGPITSAGGYDIFVVKLAPNGSHIWSKRFGDGSDQYGKAVAVDGSGNVFVMGDFFGGVDFGGGPLTSAGNEDVFVAKFDANGNYLWANRMGDSQMQILWCGAADPSGRIVLAGSFNGQLDGVGCGGGTDIFIESRYGSGLLHWARCLGDAATQDAFGVATDASGNVFVAGRFKGTIDFYDGSPITSAGDYDIYVAKFDANSALVWCNRFGDAAAQTANGIATDESGNVLLTGSFAGTVDFGGGALTSAGGSDIFIAKFNTAGQHIWSARFGDSADQFGERIAPDGSGNVIAVGEFASTVDFGGGVLAGGSIYLAKFSPAGAHIWSNRFSTGYLAQAAGVAASDSLNVAFVGSFIGAIDFGGGPLTSAGANDIFIAKFRP